MIALFISSFIALFLFLSFGLTTTKLFSIQSTHFEKILIGFIIVNTLTCLLSIFIAISISVTVGFIIFASILLFYIKTDFIKTLHTLRLTYPILLFSFPFLLVGAITTLQEPSVFDAGLYHIQCIKWIEEYATVPGLANLHHRFGFNPIVFNLYALTSLHTMFNQEIFSINFVLFSILTIYFIQRLHTTFKKEGFNNYFFFYCIFFYVLLLLSIKISSPTPDYASTAFLLFIFLRIIEIEHSGKNSMFQAYIPTILLCVYCIMAKLSALPICLIIAYIMYTYSTNRKEVFRVIIGAIIICLPWFINTILLTGWLVYPFAAIDLFNFDWKVPAEIVHQANTEIIGWARSPNDFYYAASQMSLIEWTPVWWGHLSIYTKLLIIGSITLPFTLFTIQLTKKTAVKPLLNISIITSVTGVAFWFFTAPDFRFGQIFILMALCIPFLYFTPSISLFQNASEKSRQLLFIVVCVLLLFKLIRNNYNPLTKIVYTASNNYLKPEKINSKNATYTVVFIGHEKIYKPVLDECCMDHEIPCSFLDLSSLQLRGKDLSAGFKTSSVMHK